MKYYIIALWSYYFNKSLLTPKERTDIYLEVKKMIYKGVNSSKEYNICGYLPVAIRKVLSYEQQENIRGYIFMNAFPELYLQKPISAHRWGFWWPNAHDKKPRLKALNRAIEMAAKKIDNTKQIEKLVKNSHG